MPQHVMTVLGPIEPQQVGFTLMHEHLLTSFWQAPHRFDLAGMPEDQRFIVEELDRLSATGCRTLVDTTPVGINRDPAGLRELSRRSGVNVVMGCGWYRDAYFPPAAELDRRSVDDLAQELVDEIVTGVQRTGVRPGIIGEIGTEKNWMSPTEERVHRAAARAAVQTGLALTTHSFASDIGLWQLKVLCEEGVDPTRVIIGHADSYRVRPYHMALLEQGACIEFDTLMWYRPTLFEDALDLVCDYIGHGFSEQLLISLDTCKSEHLSSFGGPGLTGVAERIIPGLRTRGATDTQLNTLFVENPRRLLTITTED